MILRQEILRETLKNDQGQVTVIINLSFPSLYKSESGKAPCKTFCRFYRKAAEGFRRFAGDNTIIIPSLRGFYKKKTTSG